MTKDYSEDITNDLVEAAMEKRSASILAGRASISTHPLALSVDRAIERRSEDRMKASALVVTDKDEASWRPLTGNTQRNLSPLKQERMYEIAVYCWENTPLGKRIIEIIKDFIVGEGFPVECKNEQVLQAIKDFWYDPLNQLDIFMEKHAREQWLFGVLCLPAFTGERTGYLRIGYLDPAQIKDVVTDPGNVKMIIGVIMKDEPGQAGQKLKTILPKEADEVLSRRARAMRDTFTDGECFYSAVNNLTNNPLGRSELLVSADWIDAHESFLFDALERQALLNSYVWDVEVKGGDPAKIKAETDKIAKSVGDVFGHNENVALEPKAPDLKAQDISIANKTAKNHVLGAHGFPSFWFGDGDDANRAVGVEMGTPAFKSLASKQRAFKAFWELIIQTAIDRRRAARTLVCSDEDAQSWSLLLPELVTKDVTKTASAFQSVLTALAVAIQQEILDMASARKICLSVSALIGVELDEKEIEVRLKEEAEKREQSDYRTKTSPGSAFEPSLVGEK